MEPSENKITGVRYILTIGKMQVIRIEKGTYGQRLTVRFDWNTPIIATFECPPGAEVQLGDILTHYTEVLTHAHADRPSVN